MKQRRFLKSQTIWGELLDYLFNFIGYVIVSMLTLGGIAFITSLIHIDISREVGQEMSYFFSPILVLIIFIKRPYDKKYFKLPIKDMIISALMGFILVVLAYFFIFLFQKLHIKLVKIDWLLVFYYTLMLFNAALLEELLVRGILLNIFLQKDLKWVGILFSSFIWSLFHIDNNGFNLLSFVNIFIIGIFFSIIFIKKKNLTFVTFMHFSWNLTLGIIFGSNVSGLTFLPKIFMINIASTKNVLITGGKFGIEASIITTFLFLAIDLYLIFRKNRSKSI